MSKTAYSAAKLHTYRITLTVDALDDFDPHQIDWRKHLDIQPMEKLKVYVEDLDSLSSWSS